MSAVVARLLKILCRPRCISWTLYKWWEHVLYSCVMVFILLYDWARQEKCPNLLQILHFKSYLRCKTITSQNLSSEVRLRIFLFYRKVMFRSQDVSVFVLLTTPWFTKSVTPWCVLVNETRCIFENIFWTTTH